ncbi:MAG: YesL family protein [Butyribacter sp.]|nr:YesL family protein [bacterium]MDY3853649.1 YesL family protein [Butyribacter sp.]
MGRFFAPDSKPMLFLSKVFDILIVSILFLLCSIPVITIGPALCALYYTTRKIVTRREGYVVRTFFHSFRINFLQAFPIWLVLLVVALLMGVNIWYSATHFQGAFRIAMLAFYFAVLIIDVILIGYIFPILSRFSCTGKMLFTNAVTISITHLGSTLGVLVLQIAFYFSIAFFFAVFPIALFVLPVCYAKLQQLLLERIFAEYIDEESEEGSGETDSSDSSDEAVSQE